MASLIPRCLKCLSLCVLFMLSGCSTTTRVALLSNGDLEGQIIPYEKADRWLVGKSCGSEQSLAKAFQDATLGTRYDTLVDIKVKTTVSVFSSKNCITLIGKGLSSRTMNLANQGRMQ